MTNDRDRVASPLEHRHQKLKLLSIGISPHDGIFSIGVSPHGLISIGVVPHGLISLA